MNDVARALVHQARIAAPATVVHRLVADVAAGPQLFPGHLHAEYLAKDLVRRWVVADGGVRSWVVRRTVTNEPPAIGFDHHEPEPPVRAVRGMWTFRDAAEGGTQVEVRHELVVGVPSVADRMAAGLDRNVPRQLEGFRWAAENWQTLPELTVRAEESAVINGTEDEVYAHFRDTAGPVSVCLPRLIVVKEQDPPRWLRTLTGRWTFLACAPGAVRVTATRTATLAARGATGRNRAEALVKGIVNASLRSASASRRPGTEGSRTRAGAPPEE